MDAFVEDEMFVFIGCGGRSVWGVPLMEIMKVEIVKNGKERESEMRNERQNYNLVAKIERERGGKCEIFACSEKETCGGWKLYFVTDKRNEIRMIYFNQLHGDMHTQK